MDPSNTPDILYKYSSFEGAKAIIESGKIKITPPHEFNDPFEILPSRFKECPHHCYREFINRYIPKKEIIPNLIMSKQVKNEDLREKLFDIHAVSSLINFTHNDWLALKKMFCEKFGVLCLSQVYDDSLMWAHYANSYSGIVLGFSPEKLPTWEPWGEVRYDDKRLEIDLSDQRTAFYTLSLTKSTHWQYEKEWRAIYELDSLEKEEGKYFLNFPEEAIKEVIIGAETPAEKRKEITDLVKKNYPTAKIKQAELSLDKFALDIN